MYTVSEAYRNALTEKVINDKIEGNVVLSDGTEIEITDSNLVKNSLKITHELCGEYKIGTFNLGCMKIGFFDDEWLLRDYSGAKITLNYKIETTSGWESVPLGIYIVDGQSVKRRRNTISLIAYDYGILFDCTLSDTLRSTTDTAENLIKLACEHCGVQFSDIFEKLPNQDITVTPSSAQIQSCRDLIAWCAALLCGYAVIDRTGKLRIIAARHRSTENYVDKYVKSFERNRIYVTDSRAWIATMSAYSGGKRKIYQSDYVHEDEQSARAIYTLEKNPLLCDKTETECDKINSAWLGHIDVFLQRGINAEIYGDPAIDVGDMLRCSEGDIDQRRSILGLVTKQEWRYRNFHTIVCASPVLADGFPEESVDGDTGESNETEDSGTEETPKAENPKPVKVISQLEKMMEATAGGSGGGVGVFVNEEKNAERFNDYINTSNEAGSFSHAEGDSTTASGHASHAEGYGSTASGEGSHSENRGKAEGNYSHAEGQATAKGKYSHAEGYDAEATGADSHAEGVRSKAVADYSHAEGESTAEGLYSHSEGMTTKATGHSAHAEGNCTEAMGDYSHTEGLDTKATKSMAHAEGMRSEASGYCSHAEGNTTKATGTQSHAEGYSTTASGYCSHAEGGYTVASGEYSHAGGENTIASGACQTVIGRYNAEEANTLFLVGNGTYEERKNILRLYENGNFHVSGNVTADGHVGKEYLAGDGVSITPTDEADVYTVSLTSATADKIGGVRVGNGLEIDENAVLSAKEYTAGGGIDIADGAISVNIGDGLEIGEDGKLNATGGGGGSSYTAGNGIEITQDEESDVIGVKLGEGLEFDGNGAISSVPNIQNAVIIQEKDAKYLLHEYTEVEYVAGNRIVYGGAQNSIIVQGYTVSYGTGSTHAAQNENIYSGAVLKSFSGTTETEYVIETEITSATPDVTTFAIKVNGVNVGSIQTYNNEVMGFVITYRSISGTASEKAPYGYGYLEIYGIYETAQGIRGAGMVSTPSRKHYAFASEAEYNAAVALTYEPQTLTQVNETVTEV